MPSPAPSAAPRYQPDIRERAIGYLFRVANPLVRRMVNAGLPTGGPNVLLTVRGRRSGQPRTTPVGILELRGRRFVQASFGEVGWVLNLRSSGEAIVTTEGRSERMAAVELPPEQAGHILRSALAPFRRSRVLRALLGRTLRPPVGLLRRYRIRIDETLAEYVEDARRHSVFELRSGAALTSPAI